MTEEQNPYANVNVQVLKRRECAAVQKCATIPHVGSYTVGQHAHAALELLLLLNPKPNAALIKGVHFLGSPDRWFGELTPFAKDTPVLATARAPVEAEAHKLLQQAWKLKPDDQRWLLAVDGLAYYLWLGDQLAFGNRHVLPAFNDQKARLAKLDMPEQCKLLFSAYQWGRTGA
jgi:hypothetical protein